MNNFESKSDKLNIFVINSSKIHHIKLLHFKILCAI